MHCLTLVKLTIMQDDQVTDEVSINYQSLRRYLTRNENPKHMTIYF